MLLFLKILRIKSCDAQPFNTFSQLLDKKIEMKIKHISDICFIHLIRDGSQLFALIFVHI